MIKLSTLLNITPKKNPCGKKNKNKYNFSNGNELFRNNLIRNIK